MTALLVARTSLRRYLRDRTALFFVVVLPIMVITVIGMTVRGFSEWRVAVVDTRSGALGGQLAADLDSSRSLLVHPMADVAAARMAVRRGEADIAVVIPPGFDAALRAGRTASVTVFADDTNSTQQAALSAVASVVATSSGRVEAAQFTTAEVGGTFAANLLVARSAERRATPITVAARSVDRTRRYLPEGFSYSAPTMLVLFVFINALAGGAAVIESRRLRMYERMLAAPVRVGAVVLGETLCYLALAVLQSVLIVGIGAFAFGVQWGDPLAAGALVLVWALVGTGAGVLSGTVFRTPEQASAIGAPVGIALGMLGGCMWPLEIVPGAMRTLGHLFPHAWAVDAWIGVLSRGEGIGGIARPLGMLALFAAGLIVLAAARLRRTVTA